MLARGGTEPLLTVLETAETTEDVSVWSRLGDIMEEALEVSMEVWGEDRLISRASSSMNVDMVGDEGEKLCTDKYVRR
jgi:hypothetical protein